jgi:hypothetical protein
MKKIINGRVYDTETAREVGSWYNGWSGSDYVYESLFRKRNGEYFLERENGEFTTDLFSSRDIAPLSYEEARQWAEERLDADEYIAAFGDPGEGDEDGLGRLQVKVPTRTLAAIDREVSESGRTRSEVVADLLERALGK